MIDVVIPLTAGGWWTANHVLVLTNGVLAAAAIGTAIVGVKTIKASNKVAASAEGQAKATLRQVQVSEAQLEQERETLLSSQRPVIVDTPVGVFIDHASSGRSEDLGTIYARRSRISQAPDAPTQISLSVPVRNVGTGSAFVRRAVFTVGPGNVYTAEVNRHVIPVGELARIRYVIADTDPMYPVIDTAFIQGLFAVGLTYSDLGGSRETQTVLHLARSSEGRSTSTTVIMVELFDIAPDGMRAQDPFATTGPS